MSSLLSSIVTPAIISSIVTLLINIRQSKRKDFRDAVSKRIDESRELVYEAVDAAAMYYCNDAKNRTTQSEAKLWMAEREIRLILSSLIANFDQELDATLNELRDDFDIFISELTGGNFQQKNAKADLPHIRRIAGLGAELRLSILKANDAELQKRLDSDWITKIMKFLQIKPYYKSIEY